MIKYLFKTLVLATLFYIALFGVCYFGKINKDLNLLNYLIPKMTNAGGRHITKSFYDFENRNKDIKYDIMFFGSSQAYRGYDPRIFYDYGYNSYNLGSSAQVLGQTKSIIKNYIDSTVTRVALIDVYLSGLASKNLESAYSLTQELSSDKAAFDIAFSTKDIRLINLITLRFFNNTFNPNKSIEPKYYLASSNYIPGGFSSTPDSFKTEIELIRYYNKEEHTLKPLKKILEHLEEQNIQVIISMAPNSKGILPVNKEALLADVKTICNDYDKCYTTDIGWQIELSSKNHFFDDNHLNQAGVEIYNRALIKEIEPILNDDQ